LLFKGGIDLKDGNHPGKGELIAGIRTT